MQEIDTLHWPPSALAAIERMTGEMGYLTDEVIPALKGEAERLTAENERLRGLIIRHVDAMEVAFGDGADAAALREIFADQQKEGK